MNIKHIDPYVPKTLEEGDPFDNCKLERKKYAEVLTTIVSTYADGFVLAINNKWGTGKTTFIRMWKQQLKNEKFQTLYFNAWENDFQPEVLIALISELSELRDKGEENFNSLVEKAAKFLRKAAPAVAKGVVSKALGEGAIADLSEAVTEFTTEELEGQIQSFTDAKKGIIDFRTSLEKFVKKVNNGKPVVFIIDELDRCRPNYAVSVLEEVKHLFSVPGIVFVLSIDKEQLGHAIRGVYGSEHIDSDEYLRRFIDVEYTLPEPSTDLYVDYLYDYFNFNSFFSHEERQQYTIVNDDPHTLKAFAKTLFKKSKLTLRQQLSIVSQTKLTIKSFRLSDFVIPNLLIFLVYARDRQKSFYKKVCSKSLSLQEVIDNYEKIITDLTDDNLNKQERESFLWVMVFLIQTYNNSLQYPEKMNLLVNEGETPKFTLTSSLDKSEDNLDIIRYLKAFNLRRFGGDIAIDHLIEKINLLAPFTEGK